MTSASEPAPPRLAEPSPARSRILDAAFEVFAARGYAQTSMLEIATRARVSKRELYGLIGTKHDMLVACITERAARLRTPEPLPEPQDRESLAAALTVAGARILREVSDPVVLGVFRLAIAEAERAPQIAVALDSIGRAAARRDLASLLEKARRRGLLDGDPAQMSEQFLALLWGDLLVALLLRLVEPPTTEDADRRAADAARALLRLEPSPAARGDQGSRS